MARRDFTINAIAKRLETGELLDPFKGREDLEARVLRTVTPDSFREDPLRLVRGLRFVSEHDLDPDEQTLAQMRGNAESVRLVSAERIGGGLSADGMGELSKLLLGSHPAKALRLARDTGVFAELLPELEADDFAVVQASADADDSLAVRLAALLRSLDAATTRAVLRRLRYPTQLVRRVASAVGGRPEAVPDFEPLTARRALARYGEETALDVARLRLAAGDDSDTAWLHALEQASDSPHRLSDLAIDGGDLHELGLAEGPRVGEVLATLLERVVDDPTLNTRERLLEQAKELV